MPSPDTAAHYPHSGSKVCFMSDEELAKHLLQPSTGETSESNAVAAEVLFRLWLYRGVCPDSIKQAAAAFGREHSEFHSFVTLKLVPVREKALEKDELDEESVLEKRARENKAAERAVPVGSVEALLIERLLQFRSVDGIIPLVLHEGGPAFPVPFQISVGKRGTHTFLDSDGSPLKAWDEHFATALEILETDSGVKITSGFPNGEDDIAHEEGGFALAVALALYNLENYLEINPLSVLATGGVVNGRVVSAKACAAKAALARKMGVELWVQPDPCDHDTNAPHQVLALGNDQPLLKVLELIRHSLAGIGKARPTARHAREIIARYFHLPPSTAASIQDAIHVIERNIKVLVDEDNEYLLPTIADGYILLASLHNHAGDAKSATRVLDGVESLLKGDKVRLCKLYAQRVVAFTDLGNLKEAENLGRKARAIADKLDILVPGQAEVLVETTGSLGGEALLHKAIRTGDLRDSDECYGLLSRTLDVSEELSRAGYQSTYVDSDLWHAKSAARFVLWHAFFEPTKISERVEEVRSAVEAPLLAGKYDVSGEYLKRTHFLGGYRALLKGKPPLQSEFANWPLPSLERGAPEWVLATALKYRGALKAHYGDAGARADFEEAARLLQHTQQPVIRIILWSIAVQAELSGIDGPLFDRIFEYGVADAVDYLSWDPLQEDIVDRLLENTYTDADLEEFQSGFAY
ncbi:MAG: hypothetical protein ORN83_08795 [Chthoniobacteraceae bacterium]|nr:hypothetical protein [Chthoniobacteraceae bacterium]